MIEGNDQVNAWKSEEDRAEDTDHPAGEVTLPRRSRSATRSAALSGYVGLGVMAIAVVPTLSDWPTCTG